MQSMQVAEKPKKRVQNPRPKKPTTPITEAMINSIGGLVNDNDEDFFTAEIKPKTKTFKARETTKS